MDEISDRPPDPFVRDRVTGASSGPTLSGLWGDSDRPGCRRLYLTTGLDYFVEFRLDQVVAADAIPPEQAPFVGLDATRVTLTADATLDWVRRSVGGADPFSLEARNATVQPQFTETWNARCPAVTHHFGESDVDVCDPGGGTGGGPGPGGGFGTWPTQGGRTCATCNDATCATCEHGTCVTCAGGTCVTCEGPGCESLNTCWTCGRATCQGCTEQTCATCSWTCQGTCASCNVTCDASCHGTCRGTCDTTCAGTCHETCADTCFTCAGTCQATCETCWTCFLSCGRCDTSPGWCLVRR